MFKIYGTKKLLLSFEYGLAIAKVAQDMNIELTPEIVERAEKIIEKEFSSNSAQNIAINMLPNILAIFETN